MILTGLQNKTYAIGKSMGRGGEGEVFEITNDDRILAKVYHERLSPQKEEKLRRMVGLWSEQKEQYIAWPIDFCKDPATGKQAIIIKRLINCVPLHQIISPMDRKKLFPEKSYSFLIHIARNLAIALHKIHEQGLVVGDVNEGNILVNRQGLVFFIDCDSFQLKHGDQHFPCEVGVPRYTPPEILNAGSFKNAARSFNTDNFSLAVLLFQILFLGKHPFAGAPVGNGVGIDDEETAIRERQFAYSLRNNDKKICPPKGSLPITTLPKKIVLCFHESFEGSEKRPSAAEWAVNLDGLSKSLSTCQTLKTHAFPSHVHECPWCTLNDTLGINYFQDTQKQKEAKFIQDIDRYIYSLELQFLHLPSLPHNVAPPPNLLENLNQKLIVSATRLNQAMILGATTAAGLGFQSHYFLAAVPAFLMLVKSNPLSLKTKKQLSAVRYNLAHTRNLKRQLAEKYSRIHELSDFNRLVTEIRNHVEDYKKLYERSLKIRRKAEEKIYARQLHEHLERYKIQDYNIVNIADVSRNLLMRHGIKTANDIPRLRNLAIQGLAPYIQHGLSEWHRSLAQQFMYATNEEMVKQESDAMYVEMIKEKQRLEYDIKEKYQDADLNRNVALQKAEDLRLEYTNLCLQEIQLAQETSHYERVMSFRHLFSSLVRENIARPLGLVKMSKQYSTY